MENYFWNTEEENSIKKLYILVIYNIVAVSYTHLTLPTIA